MMLGASALRSARDRVWTGLSILALLSAGAFAVPGCSDSEFQSGTTPSETDGGAQATSCETGKTRCYAGALESCTDKGQWSVTEQCKTGLVCSESLGRCAYCEPGQSVCSDGNVHQCSPSGTIGDQTQVCPKKSCSAGNCTDPCSKAAASRSYIGCEYWPTVTLNAGLTEDFSFAVVVANPQTEPVEVTVSTWSNPQLAKVTIPAESTETITLPWVAPLKQQMTSGGLFPLPVPQKSVLARGAAYRLVSSLPVTVYQFNPLDFVRDGDCKKGVDPTPGDGKCHSYSNDASLLLPRHVQTEEYMVISRPTMMTKRGLSNISSPGFFAVVATEEGATKVAVEFSANTAAGDGGLAAHKAGDKAGFTLDQWSVLQIASELPTDCTPKKSDPNGDYCDLSATTDLTGTLIRSDKKIAVFSGHNCTFVPFDRWACDHLEEQLFPTAALGKRYLASHAVATTDPTIYRIVSAEPGNKITFTNGAHGPVTLETGKYVEFSTDKDFEVSGSGRFALVQFMVGQGSNAQAAPGDPAMSLAVPAEQYRTSYRFLAPESFAQNYVNVIARPDANVMLDGAAVTGFAPIPGSEFHAAKVKISGGSHTITGSNGFGISVYGVGSYTSYMYPGGLDLKLLE